MPVIILETPVAAPIAICFDLSRSIDLHMKSTAHTGEQAIAGRTSGLITLNETVTWRARHLCVWQTLTSKIVEYNPPVFFADEMQEGIFKSFRHEHHFKEKNNYTIMADVFDYTSPYGILGKLADSIFLKKYMTRLLAGRNKIIKEIAEGEDWRKFIK
jgi:ligand-binding SRPBCC domain-containing protein